jgi:hypothetical protein
VTQRHITEQLKPRSIKLLKFQQHVAVVMNNRPGQLYMAQRALFLCITVLDRHFGTTILLHMHAVSLTSYENLDFRLLLQC